MQQTQLVDPDCSSGPVNVDYTYSYDPSPPTGIPAGRFTTVSNPYCTTSDSTYGITKTRYDALDRPVLVIPPDGTDTTNNVSTTYSGTTTGLTATVTDQAGAARKSQTDGLGRMTYVYEDPATANNETDYAYNVLDDLVGVTQKGGPGTPSSSWRTRSFQYDSLSRLTQAQNPESGTINYTYDAASNLFQKTSPQANQGGNATTTITYCYDADNRLASKTYSLQSCPVASPTVSYLYDQTSYNGLSGILNGIGRRTGMSDQSGATAWSFDPMGRTAIEQRKINGVTKQMSYQYYFDGEPAHTYYPSGNHVNFEVQAAGRIFGVVDETYNYVFGNATFAPNGAIAQMSQGASNLFPSGIYSAFFYNKRFQPALEYSLVGATPPYQWLKQKCYDYHVGGGLNITAGGVSCTFTGTTPGNNGNVYQIANKQDDNRTQNFLYDHLNRVQQANTNGPNWGQFFQIDPWGNLTNVLAVTGKTLYGGFNAAPANTKNQLPSAFSYDAAGNTLSDPRGNALTYDSENRIATDAGVTYTYDGDGERVQKSSGTLYWGGGSGDDALAESDLSGNISAEYIFFNGQRVARVDRPSLKVHYFVDDQLGSSRLLVTPLTASTATVEEDLDYTPYGIVANGTAVDHYEFNGKERDAESNLDEFGARYYASPFGRFMTPDWAAKPTDVPYANFGNPQSLNLYSYVQNNPTTVGDPDGHVDPCGCDLLTPHQAYVIDQTAKFWASTTWNVLQQDAKAISNAFQKGGDTYLQSGAHINDPYVGPIENHNTSESSHASQPAQSSQSTPAQPPENGNGKYDENSSENQQRMSQGKAPIGNDGKPIELHHEGQQANGELKEMTRTEHRSGENFQKNHQNTGRESSQIDRNKFKQQRQQYWKKKVTKNN
jgi:RHS repeat-associated protein